MRSLFRIATVYYACLPFVVCSAAFADPLPVPPAIDPGYARQFGGTVNSTVLPNGLRIITLEDHSAELVAVEVWVKAGNLYETESNNGAAHFLEHLLFKGTAKRGPGQADREIEGLGATLDATASKDSIRIDTTVSSKYCDIALDVLTDVTMRAKLDPDEMERERGVILDEIARRNLDPFRAITGLISKAEFPNHPYGRSVEGTSETVTAITSKQLRDYYETYFVPNNMAVVVVGDITQARAVAAVTQAFKDFKKKDLPLLKTPAQPPPGPVSQKVKRETKLTYCALSFPAPGVGNLDDVYPMDVLLTYMVAGYQSWMESELKTAKGIVQVVTGEFTTHKDPGGLFLMFGCEQAGVDQARQAILAKLKSIRETPLSDADVARAKRSLEGNFAFDVETFSGRAHILGFYDSLGDYKLALSYADNIDKVTPERIRQAALKYIDPDKAVVVEAGP